MWRFEDFGSDKLVLSCRRWGKWPPNVTTSWDLGSIGVTFIQGRENWMIRLKFLRLCRALTAKLVPCSSSGASLADVCDCDMTCSFRVSLLMLATGPETWPIRVGYWSYVHKTTTVQHFEQMKFPFLNCPASVCGRMFLPCWKEAWPPCQLACLWIFVFDPASLYLSALETHLSFLSLLGVCVLGTRYCHFISGVLSFWDLAAGKTFGICKWPLFLVWSQNCLVLCLSQYSTALASV